MTALLVFSATVQVWLTMIDPGKLFIAYRRIFDRCLGGCDAVDTVVPVARGVGLGLVTERRPGNAGRDGNVCMPAGRSTHRGAHEDQEVDGWRRARRRDVRVGRAVGERAGVGGRRRA